MKYLFAVCALALPLVSQAVTMDAVCTYALSQSKVVAAWTGAAGASTVTLATLAAALGFTVVPHSSGAAILTGSGGYISGTLGVASIGPAIVTVSLIVGGTAVAVELVCAPRNHPKEVARIEAAAAEFGRRYNTAMGEAGKRVAQAKVSVTPTIERATTNVTRTASDVFEYASRASVAARAKLSG